MPSSPGSLVVGDVGGGSMRLALMNVEGETLATANAATPARGAIDVLGSLMRQVKGGAASVRACLGVPGNVTTPAGIVTNCEHIPEFEGVALADELERRSGC